MKWRLYEHCFHGAGKYEIKSNDGKMIGIQVDDGGVFEFETEPPFSLVAIAARVGGKRDRPYHA
jgi:hypothetical protein